MAERAGSSQNNVDQKNPQELVKITHQLPQIQYIFINPSLRYHLFYHDSCGFETEFEFTFYSLLAFPSVTFILYGFPGWFSTLP